MHTNRPDSELGRMFPLEPLEKGLTLQTGIQTQLLLNLRPHLLKRVLPGSPVVLNLDFTW